MRSLYDGKLDDFVKWSIAPQKKRPGAIKMPDASPASIAVALDDTNSLCWDAGTCRLRYAWTGGFIDGFPYR